MSSGISHDDTFGATYASEFVSDDRALYSDLVNGPRSAIDLMSDSTVDLR